MTYIIGLIVGPRDTIKLGDAGREIAGVAPDCADAARSFRIVIIGPESAG